MANKKSKPETSSDSKPDNSVKIALISTIGVIATTLITALFAPVVMKSLDKNTTPLPSDKLVATPTELSPSLSDVFIDDFSTGSVYWDTTPVDDSYRKTFISISNGIFRWTVTGKQDGYLSGIVTKSDYSDFDLELTLQLVNVSPEPNYFEYGIGFRDTEKGEYYFIINSDEKYALKKYSPQDEGWRELIGFTKTDYLNLDGANTFRIQCKDNNIRLYLNQNFVSDWQDDSFTNGKITITAWTYKDVTATFDMTSFKLTLLAP